MTARPFLTVRIRGQKDAVRVRHRARQIASLVHFPLREQTCIAAATFVIACQLLRLPSRHAIGFTIHDNQLCVEAEAVGDADGATPVNRLAPLLDSPSQPPLRLVKPLPADRPLADADLTWLVERTKDVPCGLFAEIVNQNQEVLTLLHELQVQNRQAEVGAAAQPEAA